MLHFKLTMLVMVEGRKTTIKSKTRKVNCAFLKFAFTVKRSSLLWFWVLPPQDVWSPDVKFYKWNSRLHHPYTLWILIIGIGYLGLRKLVWGRFDFWVLVSKYISASAGFWSILLLSTLHLVQQRSQEEEGEVKMVEEKAYRAFCLSSCFFLICSACRFSFAVGSYGFHFRWAGEISWTTRIWWFIYLKSIDIEFDGD